MTIQDAISPSVQLLMLDPLTPILKLLMTQSDSPMRNWHFSNQVLAYVRTQSLDCRGARQWAKAGRVIRKDATPAYILAPTIRSGECQGFRPSRVYRFEDTEGEPVTITETQVSFPPLEYITQKFRTQDIYKVAVRGSKQVGVKPPRKHRRTVALLVSHILTIIYGGEVNENALERVPHYSNNVNYSVIRVLDDTYKVLKAIFE